MTDNRVIKSYVWHKGKCFFVSTIERDSSSPAGPDRYNETMVWDFDWNTAKRNEHFIYQEEGPTESIYEHQQVCQRLFDTGSAEQQEGA